MKASDSNKSTFYCFTPMVTLITFLIEVALGIFALSRYRHTLFGRLAILLIAFLSIFQLSEYMVCSSNTNLPWATIGWVSITFLPVLGLHLTELLTRKTLWVKTGYLVATVFSVMFIGAGQLFNTVSCPGNFVQYISSSAAMINAYPYYYGLFILLAVGKIIQAYLRGGPARGTIGWFLLGYAFFITPTILVYVILPVPLSAFPSIFCGFAVLLAFILARKVLPGYHALTDSERLEDQRVLQGT